MSTPLKQSKTSRIAHKIQSLDIFGKPISLTYKDEDTFKTFAGGCLTILSLAILL